MIIQPIRQHSPFGLVIIPVLAVMLWIPVFIEPSYGLAQTEMPWYGSMETLWKGHPLVGRIIGLLLLLAEAFFFNFLLQKHQVISKKTWIPALLVVVFGSCAPELMWPSAQQWAGLLLMGVMYILLGTYRQDKSFAAVFNAGLLLGIAGQIYLPSLVFYLFAIITMILLRPFIWREWIIFLFGMLIPFIYAGVWYFWNDDLAQVTHEKVVVPIQHKSFFLKLPVSSYALASVAGLLLFVSIGRLLSRSGTSSLKTKKGVSVLMWFAVFALIALLPAQRFDAPHFRFLIYPTAFFASGYFQYARRQWIAEAIFTLILLAIVFYYAVEHNWVVI